MKKLILFATTLSAALSVFSAEYYVDASQFDDTGSATNWSTAKQTIQAAVDLTTDGDTVWVIDGVYNTGGKVTPGYSLTNRVCITNAITVQSLNGSEETIIEGSGSLGNSNAVRGVFLTTNAALIGFTIKNGCTMAPSGSSGSDDFFGGGVFMVTNAVVSNCVVSQNEAFGGGGVFCDEGGMLNVCVFTNNTATYGGGMFCYGGEVSNCTFSGNHANYGGGAYCELGGILRNCILDQNTAKYGGGAELYYGGVLEDCTLSGNSATNTGGGARLYYGGRLNGCNLNSNNAHIGGGVYLFTNAVVSNCTITGNTTTGDGAGAYCYQGGLLTHSILSENEATLGGGGVFCNQDGTVNYCTMSNNTARGAGGVYCWSGGAVIDCVLTGNIATNGGGAYCKGGLLSNCTLSGNSAKYGGGAQCSLDAVINDSLFTNNFTLADGFGGGVHLSDAAELNRCVLIGNTSEQGGGARLWDSTGSLNNCLLIGNTATFAGAGADLFLSGTLNSCTLSGNSATNNAGGVRVASSGTLNNCIVWGNLSPRGNDIYQFGSSNVVRNTCASDWITHGTDGCITNNPLFVDGVNSNFQLQAGSPCINVGNNAYAPAGSDLNGRDRVLNGTVDMGAYEHLAAYVSDDSGNDANSGQSWTKAKQTIQAAVDLTTDGDIVWVTNGTYFLSSEISVTNAITVQSANGRDVTIVDGGGSGGGNRCFSLSGECLIGGFTIRNGSAQDKLGGGVYCADMIPIVSNCLFFANEAIWIYASPGWSGGGMFKGTAINCTFDSNGAMFGGGMAEGIAHKCVFTNNYGIGGNQWGNSYGAGMSGGEAHNCLFVKNDAYAGGGVVAAIVRNSTFINNTATVGGGAFDSTIINGTFFGNTSLNQGAGVETGLVYNCIFKNNTTALGTNDLSNSEAYNSCSMELTSGVNGNITNAPIFINAAGGDFRLQSNSPCINWGNNSVVSNATDLDGNPRIVEGVVDMGAYEYQSILGLTDSDGDGIPDDWERQHGGNQNPERTCSNGVNKVRQAYIAGLDPNDPDSRFSFLVDRSTPFGNVLRWQGVSGREYAVYSSTNLVNGFIPLVEHLITGSGTYIDSVYGDGPRFYKIDIRIDDDPSDNVIIDSPFP